MNTCTPHPVNKKQSGFTLVELAIALTIIGILLGALLKGQELVENTRITKTVTQVKEYKTALTTFRGIYGGLPGDISNTSRIPNCTTAPCSTAGDANRYVAPYFTSVPNVSASLTGLLVGVETRQFWLHMQKAGLIRGVSETGATSSPFRFGFEIPGAPITNSGFFAYSTTVTAAGAPWPLLQNNIIQLVANNGSSFGAYANQAAQIDLKVDDGKPFSGDVLAAAGGTCTATVTAGADYDESNTQARCDVAFLMTR